MAKNKNIQVVVTIEDNFINEFDSVKNELVKEGLHPTRLMPRLGTIAGTTDNLDKLRKIEGVLDVSVEQNVFPTSPKENSY